MAKKVVTPVEKESKASQGWFKRKQKPDAQKRQTLNESNKKLNHNGIPAVHGSQPAYYEGSESMYVQLQASLQQTGNLNHPDTQKKEMDYKKSLGINDLRDYHDIKSGNYISKTPAEKSYRAEVANKNITAKEPSIKETDKKLEKTSMQQPISIKNTEALAMAKEPNIKETVKTLQNTNVAQQPTGIKNTEALATAKVPDAKEIVKASPNTNVIQQPANLVPAKAIDIKAPVKATQSKSAAQEPVKANKPQVSEDAPAKKISQLTSDKPGSVASKNQKDIAPQKKENQESVAASSQETESKEDFKKQKGKNEIKSEKELKIVIPEVIKPVVTPRLDKAVDSEQSEIDPDSETTLNIIGLATVAQEFRDQGQEAKTQLESQKEVIKTLKSKIKGVEKEIQKSDADLQVAEKSVASKENLVNLVDKGLVTSINRQHKVEQEVGIYQQEYNKNKGKANDLNAEAASLLGESQEYQDPGEPDSGKLTRNLNELSSGASTISKAVSDAGNTTQKLSQEAKQAKEKNQKTQKDSAESKKVLLKSKAKLISDKQKNTKAKAELATLNPKLKESEAEGKKLNKEATALLLDSYVIESDIIRTQRTYYADMSTVEGRNSLKKKEAEKIEQTPSEVNKGETLLVAFVQLKSEEEQTAFLRNLDKSELDLLKAKYDEVITNYDANEAEKEASIGQNVESIRDAQIQGFNNKRKDALQKPLNLVTKNLNRITGLNRLWLSISMALSGVWNGITSITWTDVGKFALAIVNPVEWVKAIGSSISGIWDDVSNWKGFSEDPVGMILQKAAGVANKLLTIAGVITGILGLLTIAAAVGSFFTLGALVGVAIWLGSATATMGTITFWIGAVALGLNILNGIKNIYDIHTAKTAEVLFKNSGELKSDIVNSGMSILAMVGGKASVKGGTSVKNLAKNHPKTFGKRMFISLKNGIKTRLVSIPKKIGSLFKKGTWLKAYQGFQKAYKKAITWTKEKFQKKKPVQNDPMRYGPYEEQIVPDRMHEKPLEVTTDKEVVINSRLEQLRDAGLRIVKNENTISFFNQSNVLVAEIKDGVLRFKYSGYGGDIIMNSERTTTVLGKFAETPDVTSNGTRKFLGSKDPYVEGLPEGSFSRGDGVSVGKGNMSFLDIAEDKYKALIDKHVKKYLDQGEPIGDAKKLGLEDGNNEFWDNYNRPFLEDAFKRGDDIRLVSDPIEFEKSGFYGRELETINGENGLAKKYGYIYNGETKTYTKHGL